MRISVRVTPRSSKNTVEWTPGGLQVHLTAPPVDGAANEALIALLAERLGVAKRDIRVVRGPTSRQKVVEIVGMTLETVEQKIR